MTPHLYMCVCLCFFFSKEKGRGIAGERMTEDRGIKSSTHRDGCVPAGTVTHLVFVINSICTFMQNVSAPSQLSFCCTAAVFTVFYLAVLLFALLRSAVICSLFFVLDSMKLYISLHSLTLYSLRKGMCFLSPEFKNTSISTAN